MFKNANIVLNYLLINSLSTLEDPNGWYQQISFVLYANNPKGTKGSLNNEYNKQENGYEGKASQGMSKKVHKKR